MAAPVVVVQDLVVAQPQAINSLTALTVAGPTAGPFNGAKVGLFTNSIVPTPSNVLADFTQADYTGYALSSAVVWTAVEISQDGRPQAVSQLFTFAPSNAVTPNTVRGIILVDGAGTTLLASSLFSTPVGLNGPTDALYVVLTIKEPVQR